MNTGSTTTTTTVSGRGAAVFTAADTSTREEQGPHLDQDTKPPDTTSPENTQLFRVVGSGMKYPSSECQPTKPDVNLCEVGGRVSAVVAGSVCLSVRRQKEERSNAVVQTTTTNKVSPVNIDDNCVVSSMKMMSGRPNVRQLSRMFNVLSEERVDGGIPRHDPHKCPGGGDDRQDMKKTFIKSDVKYGERGRGFVGDVQTSVVSCSNQGEIKGRGYPCGGQSEIETEDCTDTRPGPSIGELGQETARR